MPAYLQMGHNSNSLVRDEALKGYKGIVLSPVNEDPEGIVEQIEAAKARGTLESVFDPQLYFPASSRGKLRSWSYFPSDFDTADQTDPGWWAELTAGIIASLGGHFPSVICSPAAVPRLYTDEYYALTVETGDTLFDALGTNARAMQTVVVNFSELAESSRVLAISSIITRGQCKEIYLIINSGFEPRKELRDTEALKGCMRLIALLRKARRAVTVAFTSSDMLLWKHAGATSVASGNFFNLRRFTPGRFDEPSGGGGQVAYWFEESLTAFLRESDLIRVRREQLLSSSSLENPFGGQILKILDEAKGQAWVAKGWRQYLWWFANAENRIDSGTLKVPDLLAVAERGWSTLESKNVLMEEKSNDGSWLRPWRRACAELAID